MAGSIVQYWLLSHGQKGKSLNLFACLLRLNSDIKTVPYIHFCTIYFFQDPIPLFTVTATLQVLTK